MFFFSFYLDFLGDPTKKKHEKNNADCREIITTIRMGRPTGDKGPNVYLMKGKTPRDGYTSEFLRAHGAPPGSAIVMTENAYLTNDVWDKDVTPLIIKGIRSMDVIKDHPNWWVILYVDGYKSHVDTILSQQAFADAKILLVKENSNHSQVNQAFDKHPG